MNPEKKILLLIDWYLPGYKAGGPIQSCANMVAHLKNIFQFKVVTGDTDLDEKKPYSNIKSNCWNVLPDGTTVYYFSAQRKKYRFIKSLLLNEEFDVLYLNSFFSVTFTLLPLLVMRFNRVNARVIVAPRGMMGKGSLAIKPVKKRIFIHLVKLTGLFKYVTWHASTLAEKNEIETVFGSMANIRHAINLTAPQEIIRVKRKKEKGKVKFFCLARISPVKNILAIFRYLQQVNPENQIDLDLYGSPEDEDYLNQCKNLADSYSSAIRVSFKGPIENKKVQSMAIAYHFMILPTFNENFGHAIVESLVAGCPVLISNQTPWKNLELIHAGWDIALENDAIFVEKINQCAQMEQDEFDLWSAGAYNLAEKIVFNKDGIKQNKELFLL